ncbi:MAG: glycosyltransferase family 4 protein [Burkholderiales bacterium]
MNRRIAIVRQRYNPFGGAERFVERAVAALRARGTSVTIVTRGWPAEAGENVLRCDPFYVGNVWRDWSFGRCVRKVVQSRKYDLVQSHERIAGCDVYRAGDGVHAEWLAQRSRLQKPWQTVMTRLNPYHLFVLSAEKRMFASSGLRAVICNSEMVRDEILVHYQLPREMLHVVYNGVDTELFHPRLRQELGPFARQQLGIPPTAPVALFVGSGFKRKGLDIALHALSRSIPVTYLLIVGTDKHSARYARLARDIGVAKRVRMVGGQENVLPYYGCADFFILPTIYDPFSNAALEAMACALPVITTEKCGAATLIAREQCGAIHDARDVSGIARSIDTLGQDQERARMSINARRAAEALTLDAMSIKLLSLYASLETWHAPVQINA